MQNVYKNSWDARFVIIWILRLHYPLACYTLWARLPTPFSLGTFLSICSELHILKIEKIRSPTHRRYLSFSLARSLGMLFPLYFALFILAVPLLNPVLFFAYFRPFHIAIQLKIKKRQCCAWDSNPGPQDGRRRRIHWAMAAGWNCAEFLVFRCLSFCLLLPNFPFVLILFSFFFTTPYRYRGSNFNFILFQVTLLVSHKSSNWRNHVSITRALT